MKNEITLKNIYKLFGLDKVDWKKVTTRLLFVLWLVLIFSWICKLCFGETFNIIASNETIKLISRNKILSKIYPLPFYLLSMYLVLWTNKRRFPIKNDLLIIIPIIIIYIIKIFYPIISSILEIIYFICVSKRKYRIGIAIETYLMMAIFQQLSLNLKGIGIFIDNDDLVTSSIFMIDYYIMMAIYCIYTIIRKEGITMGLFGPIFLSKKGKQLSAYRDKLLDKRAKLDSKIKDIDRAIENEKNK